MTLQTSLRGIRHVLLRGDCTPAEQTAGEMLLPLCAPGATLGTTPVSGIPPLQCRLIPDSDPWFELSADPRGGLSATASRGSLLLALAGLLSREWSGREVSDFSGGLRHQVAFTWLRNLSDFAVGSLRNARGFDRPAYLRQLALQGFTHVTVNGLGVERPFESGPPGDVYHWFYDYSPDLDQFAESPLIRGYYPKEYLSANLRYLKETAAEALRCGLVPGLHINSPRSMPEAFWARHGFLRGARIDHPRETFLPRYTLAMAHPAVQDHYRHLLRAILTEVPEIGFIHLWTNDSGSGFEFVTTLYAGRNGGPYLIREWKDHGEIARKAGENVLTYFHLIRDEGQRANPDFRLICDMGPFRDERPTIIAGMGRGIDAGDFGNFERGTTEADRLMFNAAGASVHEKIETAENNVLGVPFPWLVHERLAAARSRGDRRVLTGGTPASLAPFDINREVVRAFQLMPERDLAPVIEEWSATWGGKFADELRRVWELSDRAVRAFPSGVPYSTFAFPWFRLWARPFVPDIEAIPLSDRAYYEEYLLATFNNPARVDLNNDMMWNFCTSAEAGEKKREIDAALLPPLDEAIDLCSSTMRKEGEQAPPVFSDTVDRLSAARCFYVTMRNMLAWTESVHGYLGSTGEAERREYRDKAREMVESELANARALQKLWNRGNVTFMPVLRQGETLHAYGGNFGTLLERKIALMEEYGDREPRIDPDFMWRMPVEQSGGE